MGNPSDAGRTDFLNIGLSKAARPKGRAARKEYQGVMKMLIRIIRKTANTAAQTLRHRRKPVADLRVLPPHMLRDIGL